MRSNLLRVLATATATLGLLGVATAASADETYEVRPGDTLSDIARELDTVEHWRQLHAANPDILDPDLIFPGQVLQIAADGEVEVAPAPAAETTEAAPSTTTSTGVWDRLAQCESGGDWSIDTGNGYYGGLQFTLSSWELAGGQGYPHEASREEQIQRAERLLELQGWGAWPACASQLGLR